MFKTCKVDGCCNKSRSLGLCQKHYKRLRAHGTTDPLKNAREPIEVRFWLYVDKRKDDECWEWTGAIGPNGYGRTSDKHRKDLIAHRVSYELANGEIPAGLVVMHSCDNRKCVNPNHLSLGTHMDNMHDMIKKGRQRHYAMPGEKSPRSKLKESDVLFIREHTEIGHAEMARRFGVTASCISSVRMRFSWRHI